MDLNGEFHSDWQAFRNDLSRTPDKTRAQLLGELDAGEFLVTSRHKHLVWYNRGSTSFKYQPPPEASCLLYHALSLELVCRCSGQAKTRVHMRAALSFKKCLSNLRELSQPQPLGQSDVNRALVCHFKNKYLQALHLLYISSLRADEVFGYGLLKASNGLWLPEEADNAKAHAGGTPLCIVDIVISDMQWFCDCMDRAADEDDDGGDDEDKRPGERHTLSEAWCISVMDYLVGTFTSCLTDYLNVITKHFVLTRQEKAAITPKIDTLLKLVTRLKRHNEKFNADVMWKMLQETLQGFKKVSAGLQVDTPSNTTERCVRATIGLTTRVHEAAGSLMRSRRRRRDTASTVGPFVSTDDHTRSLQQVGKQNSFDEDHSHMAMMNPLAKGRLSGAPEPELGFDYVGQRHEHHQARKPAADNDTTTSHTHHRWQQFLKEFRTMRKVVHIDMFDVYLSESFDDNERLLNAVSTMAPSATISAANAEWPAINEDNLPHIAAILSGVVAHGNFESILGDATRRYFSGATGHNFLLRTAFVIVLCISMANTDSS